ncbi:MAG: hypothetical protein COB12_09900 [Flavobacterium sp.]|nr:MAG: hypothetical protein COB12_09900 [Flavobacterium sp.]
MKSQSTYNPSFFKRNSKIIFVFGFLLMLMAKPIANIPLVLEDSKYELVDLSEKENSSKKENISESEKEHKIINVIYEYLLVFELKKQPSYFVIQPSFLNYKQDIQLPPPRV